MRRTLPLIRLDPGWLFLLAGLALVLAAAVIPSGKERQSLEAQRAELEQQEKSNFEVLGAYARFVQDLEDRDPALLRRLAAAQLNMIPKGETPLLMASTVNSSVSEWVESTVEAPERPPVFVQDTLLSRWTEGGRRLWAIGAGAFMVFIGLLLSPAAPRVERQTAVVLGAAHVEAHDDGDFRGDRTTPEFDLESALDPSRPEEPGAGSIDSMQFERHRAMIDSSEEEERIGAPSE